MLSNTCKYAIRSIIYLAINVNDNRKIGIKKISEELEIPTPFLGKILQNLVRQKLLASTKGPNGGFSLGKDPSEITLMEIVRVLDGMDSFENCLIGLRSCKSGINKCPPCPVHNQLVDIRSDMYKLFNKTTIKDLIFNIENTEEYISL